MKSKIILPAFLSFLLFTGCATNIATEVHQDYQQTIDRSQPQVMMIAPIDISVKELTASGATEEVPDWTEAGLQNIESSVMAYLDQTYNMTPIDIPDMTIEDQQILDQHIQLYKIVSANYFRYKNLPAYKYTHTGYNATLGDGLGWIKQKYDTDLLLIVTGNNSCSSGGRVATAAAAAILLGATVQMGHAILHAGVVDLETGNILWTNTSYSESIGFRSASEAGTLVKKVFSNYPGLGTGHK